jgi:hypothetical protein
MAPWARTIAAFAALLLASSCDDAVVDAGDADADADTDGDRDADADVGAGPDGDVVACACDRRGGTCDASEPGSTAACECDVDCEAGSGPCGEDGACDDWCPEGVDVDCGECRCDYYSGVCEAADYGSTENCSCDGDCTGAHRACERDSHCDTWCPGDSDPDCPPCDCDYTRDICEPSDDGTLTVCECDPDCADGGLACREDGHCDTWCDPGGLCQDPDCTGAGGSGYHTGHCTRS